MGVSKPNVSAIVKTICDNQEGYDDVLFLGGEPCLYLKELLDCVERLKEQTNLKVYVTTSIPKICYDEPELFQRLMVLVDGMNLSVQHHDEAVADRIRCTQSQYDRQAFYKTLARQWGDKIRINLNIVKPFLYTREDITDCVKHYSVAGFTDIKISEIQHGEDVYVSFEDTFGVTMGSPYYSGCQQYVHEVFPDIPAKVLLKRSCFLCESTLKASLMDGIKAVTKQFKKSNNKYGVVYGNGELTKGWR